MRTDGDFASLSIGFECDDAAHSSLADTTSRAVTVDGLYLEAIFAIGVTGPDRLARPAEKLGLPDAHSGSVGKCTGRARAVCEEVGRASPFEERTVATVIRDDALEVIGRGHLYCSGAPDRGAEIELFGTALQRSHVVDLAARVVDDALAVRGCVADVAFTERVLGVLLEIASCGRDRPELCLATDAVSEIRGEDEAIPIPSRAGEAGLDVGQKPFPVALAVLRGPQPNGHPAPVALPVCGTVEVGAGRDRRLAPDRHVHREAVFR